jgi:uncharacterized protein (DUF58 family)
MVRATGSVFTLVPRRRLIGLSFGGMHSARRGRGSDVAGSRPYRPGDDVHAIDWPASARLSSATGNDEFIVRESYAEEAPRVVVLLDHRPSMALYPPDLPWLAKPAATSLAAHLVLDSAIASRGYLGYLDLADGEPSWSPPRSQRDLPELREARPFTAPDDVLDRAFTYLSIHRRAMPAGSFVFVFSDFLVAPPDGVWVDALEHRWDVIPVVIQDPVWEQSFPDVAGIVVPVADAASGRVSYVRLTRREVAERREANERRFESLLRRFDALDLQPVVLSSADPGSVLSAFLTWSEWRKALKGRPW